MCWKVTDEVETRLMTISTDDGFWPITGWMYAHGVDGVRSTLKSLAESGLFQGRMAVQYATAVTDITGTGGRDDWIALGSYNVDEGMWTQEASLTTTGKMYFRIGICFSLVSGSALAQADVRSRCSFRDAAKALAKGTLQLPVSSTAPIYTPLGGWVGAYGLDSTRSGLVITGVTGSTYRTQLCCRTADIDPNNPNSWALIGSVQSGAVKVCQDVSVSSITNPGGTKPFWIQFGTASWLNAAGNEETATVALDLTGRYV